jgi:hypothetical protein
LAKEHPSARLHGNADFALEFPCSGIAGRTLRVVLEAGAGIEQKPAGRQPVAQQRRPCLTHLFDRAAEMEHRVLATGQGRLERAARRNEIRRDLRAGVVPALLGGGDARVVMADPVARVIGAELVHDRPRYISLLPEARDGRAIGAEVPKAGKRCGLTGDEADLHDGVLKCLVPPELRPGEPGWGRVVGHNGRWPEVLDRAAMRRLALLQI